MRLKPTPKEHKAYLSQHSPPVFVKNFKIPKTVIFSNFQLLKLKPWIFAVNQALSLLKP